MQRLTRPWSSTSLGADTPFGPSDVLMSEVTGAGTEVPEAVLLMAGEALGNARHLYLHPYPKKATSERPARRDFPVRPKIGVEPQLGEDMLPFDTLRRMNEVAARIQELEEALDDPANVWPRLRASWARAEREEDPRMAEIVRQAKDIIPVLRDLEKRVRKVLRRTRELTPLDRVQEMDRTSMVWQSRQPGRTIAERAGAGQRILATVRHENFDTLENRVLRAYLRLSSAVAREWLREHAKARDSNRFRAVDALRKLARRLDEELCRLGVTVAQAGVTPNYVLMQDRGYRLMHEAWIRLLERDKTLDDLWAWQAQSWTDFTVLAIVLALDELPDSELIAQSPMVWNDEAKNGRWFDQDRPLAVFWLRDSARVVEVQARPETPGVLLTLARAHVGLKISDARGQDYDRRIAVWTPHSIHPIDLDRSAAEASLTLMELKRHRSQLRTNDIMDSGLILCPAHDQADAVHLSNGGVTLDAISLGASGEALRDGIAALKRFVQSDFMGVQA